MSLVFGRAATEELDRLDKELQRIAASEDPQLAALAQNLQIDHRISPERGVHFLSHWIDEYASSPDTAISNALLKLRRLISSDPRAQILATANNCNHLNSEDSYANGDLATVVSAQGLILRARRARILDDPADRLFSSLGDDEALWAKAIVDHGEEQFVQILLDIRQSLLSYNLLNPCWGAVWSEFEDCAVEPAHWKHAVGLRIRERGECLLLLRYSLPTHVQAIRPTQLEAGESAEHFPSPAHWILPKGGCCMITGAVAHHDPPLVREFIHEAFPLHMAHWRAAQSARCACTSTRPAGPVWVAAPPAGYYDLHAARQFHRERLKTKA